MAPLTWAGALLAFLRSLPDIIRFLTEAAKVVNEVKDAWERARRMKELKDALAQARKDGDTSKIEDLFRGRRP